MSGEQSTPAQQFASLVEAMLARSQATYGSDESKGARRSFGATSLKANGKIFAMLVKDRLVVKLPAQRVEELVAEGVGDRFDPGHGRIQKEWISVASADYSDWLAMASESEAFVGKYVDYVDSCKRIDASVDRCPPVGQG